MNIGPIEVRSGIELFKGRLSRNLAVEPMVSNAYFLEDGDEVVLFDPSPGRDMARRIEDHIRGRRRAGAKWQRAFLVAGHSHLDHAGNFYLSQVIAAPETHIYVHESGFQDGKVMNQAGPVLEKTIDESRRYYSFYLTFPLPGRLFMYPLAALDAVSPARARKAAGRIAAALDPGPVDGFLKPEPLREDERRTIDVGNFEVIGWRVGSKVVLPTPGHSACSVSLFWPERKAVFVSHADWIGNPVFVSSSVRDSISSLETLKCLAGAGKVDLLLPGHGRATEGSDQVVSYLDFHIRLLEVMRNEVLSAYGSCGKKDVGRLVRLLAQESPLFRQLNQVRYPRFVVSVHSIVTVCLREEGMLH